jgi:hypothetical protein
MRLPRAIQRRVYVRQNILLTDILREIAAQPHIPRLSASSADHHGTPRLAQSQVQRLHGMKAAASRAVMLRIRTITTSPNPLRSSVASASFSVIPKRNGPWIRNIVT